MVYLPLLASFFVALCVILYGSNREWKYVNYKVPIGRLGFLGLALVGEGLAYAGDELATYGQMEGISIVLMLLGFLMMTVGFCIAFLAGMRRMTDLTTPSPFWYPPIFGQSFLLGDKVEFLQYVLLFMLLGLLFIPGKYKDE